MKTLNPEEFESLVAVYQATGDEKLGNLDGQLFTYFSIPARLGSGVSGFCMMSLLAAEREYVIGVDAAVAPRLQEFLAYAMYLRGNAVLNGPKQIGWLTAEKRVLVLARKRLDEEQFGNWLQLRRRYFDQLNERTLHTKVMGFSADKKNRADLQETARFLKSAREVRFLLLNHGCAFQGA